MVSTSSSLLIKFSPVSTFVLWRSCKNLVVAIVAVRCDSTLQRRICCSIFEYRRWSSIRTGTGFARWWPRRELCRPSTICLRPLFSSPVSPSSLITAGDSRRRDLNSHLLHHYRPPGRCTMSSAVNRIGISRLKYLDSSLNNDNHARGRGLMNDCPVRAFPGLAFGLFCGLDSDTSHLQASRLRLPLHQVTCCCLGRAAKFT